MKLAIGLQQSGSAAIQCLVDSDSPVPPCHLGCWSPSVYLGHRISSCIISSQAQTAISTTEHVQAAVRFIIFPDCEPSRAWFVTQELGRRSQLPVLSCWTARPLFSRSGIYFTGSYRLLRGVLISRFAPTAWSLMTLSLSVGVVVLNLGLSVYLLLQCRILYPFALGIRLATSTFARVVGGLLSCTKVVVLCVCQLTVGQLNKLVILMVSGKSLCGVLVACLRLKFYGGPSKAEPFFPTTCGPKNSPATLDRNAPAHVQEQKNVVAEADPLPPISMLLEAAATKP